MFSSTTEQLYHDYQYDSRSITMFNYSEYSTDHYNYANDYIQYQTHSSLIYPQEQIIPTNKIHINPFFKPRSLNPIKESSSSRIEKDRSPSIERQNTSSSSSLKSRSRSPPSDRKVIISSKKNRRGRQIRKEQREKLIQEKELLLKRQSASILKHKRRRSSPDRWEHKEEKLERLYKEYSDEDIYKQWKPLILEECFELYQYAFDKYHGKSNYN